MGVVGTFVWDTIHHPDLPAGPLEQWGGIAYSLSAFAAACPSGWEVVPLVCVGADLAEQAATFLHQLGIRHPGKGFRIVDQPNNRVELRYRTRAERYETLTGGVAPWPASELVPLVADLDALYINYLSGFEMTLETATRVRREFALPIYADLHSLFLAEPGAGPRQYRLLPDADAWLESADIIQVNEEEHRLLGMSLRGRSGGHFGEEDTGPVEGGVGLGMSAELSGIEVIPAESPTAVLVTRGGEGATFQSPGDIRAEVVEGSVRIVWNGGPRKGRVPLAREPTNGDPTGCGDVWGAVVFCGWLAGLDLPSAIEQGHLAAAARLEQETIETLPGAIARALTPGR